MLRRRDRAALPFFLQHVLGSSGHISAIRDIYAEVGPRSVWNHRTPNLPHLQLQVLVMVRANRLARAREVLKALEAPVYGVYSEGELCCPSLVMFSVRCLQYTLVPQVALPRWTSS